MRIDRLDLWRFGKFTDYSLDFGDLSPTQPDMHIVYGPNEAGKSTLMAAYLDFLFGFHPKTTYNFKHANSVLKVGAHVSIGDETKEYHRLKKNKDSLVDAKEQPVVDNAIQQQLAGLNKDAYASMFSLDDFTLEQGGESILASKGDLGKLLYSATTGVAQLSESLLELRAETAGFYAKGKRKFELADLKKRLKEIEVERKQIDTEAAGYSKLLKARSEADALYESLGVESAGLKLDIHKLKLRKSAFPRLSSLKRLQHEMMPLTSIPEVPDDWYEEIRLLQDNRVEIKTREQDLANKIAELDESISAVELDEPALNVITQWQQAQADRDQYLVACSNLAELQQQLHLCEHELANCLRKLDHVGVEQPASLLLNASTQASIHELIEQHPTLLTQRDAAKTELSAATDRHKENCEKFVLEGGTIETEIASDALSRSRLAIADVEREIAAITGNELTAQRRAIEQQLATLQDELDVKIIGLSPWEGDGLALQSMKIPHTSEVQALRARAELANSRISELDYSQRTTTKSIEHARSQQQAYSVTGLVDDAESSRLRRERDEAWVVHRQVLQTKTADEFERAMRSDDASQAMRLQNTETVAQISQLTREIFVAEQSNAQTQIELQQLHIERDDVARDLAQLVVSMSPAFSSTLSIDALDSWLDARTNTLQLVRKVSALTRELASIDEQVSVACTSLTQSLIAAGIRVDGAGDKGSSDLLVGLLKLANTSIIRETVLSGLRDQMMSSQRQLNARSAAVDSAKQSLEQWRLSWKQVCESCWIGEQSPVPGATVVREILLQLKTLEQQLALASSVQEKIARNQRIVDTFDQSMSALAATLNVAFDNVAGELLYQTLDARIGKAVANEAKLRFVQDQKNEYLELQKSNHEKSAVNVQSIERMCKHFSVESIDDVELKLQQAKNKQNLQQRIAVEEKELLDMLTVSSLAEVIEQLDDFDVDTTQLTLDGLERASNDIELQLQEAHTARDQARKGVESVGGDEAVALLNEQRSNLLLQIQEKATRYLQQYLALIAADAALKIYRDNHRSSMMKKASDAFASISQGRYSRLDTIQDGASEKLIAIDKDGQSKLSDQLSKGTRFQLYLALRIAGYHEYASTRPPVPFIADDIMETFDDERAASTFEVLGEMARVGQVIYLTHHQHLCDIARKVVPGARIHQLT